MTDHPRSDLDDTAQADDAAPRLSRRRVMRRTKWLVGALFILLAIGAGRTVVSRMQSTKALEAGTAERAVQYVKVASPRVTTTGQTLALPGTLLGNVQAPIAARASGYLKRWYKDIGSKVEKGELLAEIETPEIDQQLTQALAAREQAASSLTLAKSTMDRWEALRKRDAVSQQELDEKRSTDAQARANLAAADANVARLREMQSFKRVVAPFAGVITRRSVDVGDLIDAGGGAGRALFTLTQNDPLRVYVNVPQSYAQLVRPGQVVSITQSEIAGRRFEGKVARTAGAIDAGTRTMQVEVTLPNKDGALLPGAYVQVSLPLEAGQGMLISANTLLIRADGVSVATVGPQGRVKLKPVRIGRNLGNAVEVLEGVDASDKLVLNPSDSIADGDQVAIAPPESEDAKGAKGSPAGKKAS
jgi:RND family efflux transporter MFP subunit